jgi:hypothetical protein
VYAIKGDQKTKTPTYKVVKEYNTMFGKSQNYRVEIVKDGQPIVLRPGLNLKDSIYWADRIKEMDTPAYVTLVKLTEQTTNISGAIEWTEVK